VVHCYTYQYLFPLFSYKAKKKYMCVYCHMSKKIRGTTIFFVRFPNDSAFVAQVTRMGKCSYNLIFYFIFIQFFSFTGLRISFSDCQMKNGQQLILKHFHLTSNIGLLCSHNITHFMIRNNKSIKHIVMDDII
jgi:hypothetical protein